MMLLALLSERPGHGYALIRRLGSASAGAFELPEGTIYPALQCLEADGLVASRWEVVAGRRRRVYSLTGAGSAELRRRRGAWQDYWRAVDGVLGAA